MPTNENRRPGGQSRGGDHVHVLGLDNARIHGLHLALNDGECFAGGTARREVDLLGRGSSPINQQDLLDDFEERAAIAEFDAGLSRSEAERFAVRDLHERLERDPPNHRCILSELATADRLREHPAVKACLVDLGLGETKGPAWGVASVVAMGTQYRPAEASEEATGAIVVPAVQGGAVHDLVACSLASRRMFPRLGVASLIGADELEAAQQTGDPLLVFDNAIRWLRGCMRGVSIIDWEEAPGEMEGVAVLLCSSGLAPRLHAATSRCWPRPTIAIPGAHRHAA
jgi:hypothetical protein